MNTELLDLIEEIWAKNPTLRLCQLIGNCFKHGDLYYIKDSELIKKLKKTYIK